VAAAHDARQVSRIKLAIGPLSGVEAELLERAFTVARMGTLAETAILDIEETPVIVWCEACGTQSHASLNRLLCGSCGTWRVTLRSGDELLLKSLELEFPDQPEVAEAGRGAPATGDGECHV